MRYGIFLISGIVLLCLINACSQAGSIRTDTEKLVGKWKAADSTAFRGKEIEFFPDHQVNLMLAGGGEQNGQYEIKGNAIIFSIGDAPPFTIYFRLEDDNLFLSFPDSPAESKYVKSDD